MSTPIISAIKAQDLNRQVQEKIDPHLFLFCNYEPTVSYAISEDGMFLIAIQDLYKFGIDTNCILKNYKSFVPRNTWFHYDQLREILDLIDTLRAVTDHNQSIANGKIEQEHLRSYQVWLQRTLGKPAPKTQQDFVVLNEALRAKANELIRLVEDFISDASANPNREGVVKEWTDRTLRWYSNNTKTEIYKGQLMNAYVANANAAGNNRPDLQRMKQLNWKIGRWIEAALPVNIARAQREIAAKKNQIENALDGSNPMVKALRNKMTAEQLQNYERSLRQSLESLNKKQENVAKKRDALARVTDGKYVDFFFRSLEAQLGETIQTLNQSGKAYTLLPQDLLQEDIAIFFRQIPSPEEDF